MPIFHRDIEQNTEEWLELRAGKITGSKCPPLLVSGKSEHGFGAGAMTLKYELISEVLMSIKGSLADNVENKWQGNSFTEFGHSNEDLAREEYELRHFEVLEEVGFVERSHWIGTSPDRLVKGRKKGVEFKCLPKKHAQIIDTNKPEKNHVIQSQWNMWVSEYQEWDLVYFNPLMPEKASMKIFSLEPDRELFEQFEERSEKMIDLVCRSVGRFITKELYSELLDLKV